MHLKVSQDSKNNLFIRPYWLGWSIFWDIWFHRAWLQFLDIQSCIQAQYSRWLDLLDTGTTGGQQDFLEMPHLHSLACSVKQCLKLYQYILEKYPANLISKDEPGDLQTTYAVLDNAPQEVIQFLMGHNLNFFPDCELNWTRIIETLTRENAPLVCI